MSYPDYPKNRLIVQGVDLTERFKMVLADGYTLSPPEPKTYIVNIPGGNGCLDLTESLIGDTVYNNRKAEFTFYILNTENFERIKTDVSNFLHGREFDYQLTMDPGYTYHGRFTVKSYEHESYVTGGIVGIIKIEVSANPYKYRKTQVYRTNAVGGITVYIPSGRKRVRPTIETGNFVKVIYNNKLLRLPQGSWAVNDLLFTEGDNELYLCSYDIRNLKWGDMKTNSITWGKFKEDPLYKWYKSNGDGTYVVYSWDKAADKTWGDLMESKWVDMTYLHDVTGTIDDIYIKYEWGDL